MIKYGSVTIHQQNLQSLPTELFKVTNRIAPIIMEAIFSTNETLGTEIVSANNRSQSLFYNPVNPKKVNIKIWDIVLEHKKRCFTSMQIVLRMYS